jgi:hypothetical protein
MRILISGRPSRKPRRCGIQRNLYPIKQHFHAIACPNRRFSNRHRQRVSLSPPLDALSRNRPAHSLPCGTNLRLLRSLAATPEIDPPPICQSPRHSRAPPPESGQQAAITKTLLLLRTAIENALTVRFSKPGPQMESDLREISLKLAPGMTLWFRGVPLT